MMETEHFDRLARSVSRLLSRRALTATLGVIALGMGGLTEAKKKRRRKKRKKNKQQVKFNDFGCVNVGNFCKASEQCCSGICVGHTCQAHDAATCQAGETFEVCGGSDDVACVSSSDTPGECVTTTGNAPFCAATVQCFACQKDVDCEGLCGEGAACFPCGSKCGGESGGMACASVNDGGCVI